MESKIVEEGKEPANIIVSVKGCIHYNGVV